MDYYEEQEIEPPRSDPNDEDEEEEEDADIVVEAAGVDGRSDVATTSLQEVVDVDDSEDANDAVVEVERERCSSQRVHVNEAVGGATGSLKDDNDEENGDLNPGEVDGLFCPICFEAWSSGGGDHHVCCLPCGHIYGLSCIKKWLRGRGSSKCPQCKKKCTIKDIRLLYATRVVAIDEELQKTVRSLEAKCASLEKKSVDWSKKESEWKKIEADLCKQVQYLKERTHDLEDLLEDMTCRVSGSFTSNFNCLGDSTMGHVANHNVHIQGCSNKFVIQGGFQIPGARLFDIDSSNNIFVFARRLSGIEGTHFLTKVSLFSNHDWEDFRFPQNRKAVKDLKVSPHAGLVLLASLGKKLSVLSMENNTTILTYNLPAAAWSCSWDICSSHYVYTGLQNGTVLQFDMRHTARHVESLTGLTSNPIHTLHSLSPNSSLSSGIRSVLTASSLGLCQWNFGGSQERPYLIHESDRQGVCISLAYCKSNDYIVASYRPKIEISGDLGIAQPMLTVPGRATWGCHVLYRRMGCIYQKLGTRCANVSDIRLPKSAIIDGVYQNPVFASGDDLSCELVLQELPSQMVVEHLKPQNYPISDVKYNSLLSSGLLGCLSEDSFQLFTAKLL